jgi:hypothetical protein
VHHPLFQGMAGVGLREPRRNTIPS